MSPPRKARKKQRLLYSKYSNSNNRKPGQAHTILSFCENNTLSESEYYKMKRENKHRREIKIGKRIIITSRLEERARGNNGGGAGPLIYRRFCLFGDLSSLMQP